MQKENFGVYYKYLKNFMVKNPTCDCPYMQQLYTIIGKKWALFIMHSVQSGANSFTEIRKKIGDANTKILTDRLAELVENNILSKTENGKYTLTKNGDELTTRLVEIAHWWAESQSEFPQKK